MPIPINTNAETVSGLSLWLSLFASTDFVTFLGCTHNYFDQCQSNLGQQAFGKNPMYSVELIALHHQIYIK